MKKNTNFPRSKFKINNSKEGIFIEEQLVRMKKNNEPIKATSPIIYTERAKGVQPQYDIRTDKMQVAQDARSGISRSRIALKEAIDKRDSGESIESIQATAGTVA